MPVGRCPLVAAAGQDDDPSLRGRLHLRQQPVADDEVAEVIGDELLLQAVDLLELGQGHDPGIQDQHVDGQAEPAHGIGARDDGIEVGELDRHGDRPAPYLRPGFPRLLESPRRRDARWRRASPALAWSRARGRNWRR